MSDDLLSHHDAVLSDLDGVVYLGPEPIEAAVRTFAEVRRRGIAQSFVTNNAGRGAEEVAQHLREIDVPAQAADVATSAQAGAALLARHLPAGSPVLVVGSPALIEAATDRGLVPASLEQVLGHDGPRGVLQGFEIDLPWSRLNDATRCVQAGAVWVATNTDSTRPTHEGVMPGTGMMVHAVAVATGQEPLVAGKPHRPLFDVALERTAASKPIFLGDRLDTDIAGARAAGITSVLVLSGAHGKRELATMATDTLPDHLGADASILLDPPAVIEVSAGRSRGDGVEVLVGEGRPRATAADPGDRLTQLELLRCLVALRRSGVEADWSDFCDQLDTLG